METITTKNLTAPGTAAIIDRIAAADATERDEIRQQIMALSVRRGIKSGQQGRIRAILAYLEN